MSTSALAALRKAAKGLLYMSEKDAPFKTVALKEGETPTKKNIAELLAADPESPVEEVAFTKFFVELTKPQKWHAEDEKAVIKRYQTLLGVFREQLSELKVFKIGRVRIKIAILGKNDVGRWIGLETDSLET